MAEQLISHVFNLSASDYWDKLFFDDEYNQALFVGRLKFESWNVVNQEEDETRIRRVVDAVPAMPDLPGPLKRVVRDGLGYREDGVFDRATKRYTITVTTKSLPGKVNVTGVTHTEPIDEHSCRRVHLAGVVAKVFGVGGMIESRLLSDMARSYEKAATFSNRWIEERGL